MNKRIAVAGTGYVGLSISVLLAQHNKVTAVDIIKFEVHSYISYTVVTGDSLWRIAQNKLGSGTRYPEIKTLNSLTSNTIYTGQKLLIP